MSSSYYSYWLGTKDLEKINLGFHFFFKILKSLILTCVPKHEPPSHLPPHNISLGHPCAPASSMLYPASNIDCRFISYMIICMFQCHSPKSSHPLLLPQSPKAHSTHLCLFCCLAYRVIITIFLNSLKTRNVSVYCIGVFLSGLLHSV